MLTLITDVTGQVPSLGHIPAKWPLTLSRGGSDSLFLVKILPLANAVVRAAHTAHSGCWRKSWLMDRDQVQGCGKYSLHLIRTLSQTITLMLHPNPVLSQY